MQRMMLNKMIGMTAAMVLGACGVAGLGDDLDAETALETGSPTAQADDGKADGIGGAPTSTYYTVRQDARRCAYPMCGGSWIKRVNRTTTYCGNGVYAAECYVVNIDYRNLNASTRLLDTIKSKVHSSLFRGYRTSQTINGASWGKFVATEAWLPSSGTNTPSGKFRRVQDNGRRCITFPCMSTHAARLNETYHTNVSGLDFAPSGAPEAEVNKALELVGTYGGPGILASGSLRTDYNVGPAGNGLSFVMNQFYFKTAPTP